MEIVSQMINLIFFAKIVEIQNLSKGRRQKKKTSYSVTLSLKVGGGQDEIILLGAAKIVTS